MEEKFQTLFLVKVSLISLYLALTIPIPFISIEKFKILSIILFVSGLFLIINITSDYVETCNEKVSYRTSLISRIFGKKNWEIPWKEIKLVKSFSTSQGSKVYYFATCTDENYLMPQRIEDFERFLSIVSKKTDLDINDLSYISPLWTYSLLTFLSSLMVIGELIAFLI